MKRLLFALTLLVCGAAHAATVTAYPTVICDTASSHNYNKAYIIFSLPSLGGGTITGATLTMVSGSDQGGSMTVTANTSNANHTFTNSTAASTLTGYTLDTGSTGNTQDFSTSGGGTYTWNVLGNSNWGVTAAYNAGSTCTIILTNSVYSGSVSTTHANDITLGNNSLGADAVFNQTVGVTPYITITYTPAASTRRLQRAAVNGHY